MPLTVLWISEVAEPTLSPRNEAGLLNEALIMITAQAARVKNRRNFSPIACFLCSESKELRKKAELKIYASAERHGIKQEA